MVTIATDQMKCYNLGVSTTLKNIQEVFTLQEQLNVYLLRDYFIEWEKMSS